MSVTELKISELTFWMPPNHCPNLLNELNDGEMIYVCCFVPSVKPSSKVHLRKHKPPQKLDDEHKRPHFADELYALKYVLNCLNYADGFDVYITELWSP